MDQIKEWLEKIIQSTRVIKALKFLIASDQAKEKSWAKFLINSKIIDTIVNIIEIKNKFILEVGPGTGNLTTRILEKNPKKVNFNRKG